jgi:hypothetical protein
MDIPQEYKYGYAVRFTDGKEFTIECSQHRFTEDNLRECLARLEREGRSPQDPGLKMYYVRHKAIDE